MVRVSKRPQLRLTAIVSLHSPFRAAQLGAAPSRSLACHVRRAPPPALRCVRRAGRGTSGCPRPIATSGLAGRPVSLRRSATVIPVVSSPRVSTSDEQRLGRDQRRVQRRGDGQRVVDEGAVEAVVARRGTPCRSAARRRRSGRSGCWPRSGSRASGPRRAPARSSRPACCRRVGRAGRRRRAGSAPARSRRDPAPAGGGSTGRRRSPPPRPGRRSPRPPGSQWMFHSVVGVVLPETPKAPPIRV